jgi:acyl-coenzyme A synthetase/AMP-(fatty) acid ligase
MIATMMGVEIFPIKPGSVGKAVCGYNIKIFNEEGIELGAKREATWYYSYLYLRIFIRSMARQPEI